MAENFPLFHDVRYQYVDADGVKIFYREAGNPASPAILLLHGFPSSSHQYRNLIPLLAKHFHVISPDFPGFGFTEVPAERNFTYSFDALAITLAAFLDRLQLKRYAIYLFDYGAPVGLRLALAYPDRVSAVISQNGNAYLEGLGDAWKPLRDYWSDPSSSNRQSCHDAVLNLDAIRWQYTHGVADPSQIAPEGYYLDMCMLERPGNKDIQLDLFLDYANNLALYPAFQAYFRASQVPTLVIWGENDPFFLPAGAEAFKRDNQNAIVEFLPTGHFAVETHAQHIANRISAVLGSAID